MTCENCKFFQPVLKEQGECHIDPPTAFMIPVADLSGQPRPAIMAGWPTVKSNAWCGKFITKMALTG